jgi:hypothetical protein
VTTAMAVLLGFSVAATAGLLSRLTPRALCHEGPRSADTVTNDLVLGRAKSIR